jgi:hypothetical protein
MAGYPVITETQNISSSLSTFSTPLAPGFPTAPHNLNSHPYHHTTTLQ